MAPDPGEVAAAIVGLIQGPSRPLRTVLPSPDSANVAAINSASATTQAGMFTRLNMTALLRSG